MGRNEQSVREFLPLGSAATSSYTRELRPIFIDASDEGQGYLIDSSRHRDFLKHPKLSRIYQVKWL